MATAVLRCSSVRMAIEETEPTANQAWVYRVVDARKHSKSVLRKTQPGQASFRLYVDVNFVFLKSLTLT